MKQFNKIMCGILVLAVMLANTLMFPASATSLSPNDFASYLTQALYSQGANATSSFQISQQLFRTVPDDLQQQIYSFAYECYNDPDFGKPMNAVNNWYSSLSDAEILARLIYGEQTIYTNEQRAVAWVVVNRLYSSDPFFPETLRGVMTQTAQFSTISGTGSTQARQPDTDSQGWASAVSLASIVYVCLEYYSSGYSYLEETMTRPAGITNQVGMLGIAGSGGFLSRATNGQSCILLDGDPITQVTVVDCGVNLTSINGFTSFSNYTLRNVFFNYA